MTSLAEGTVSLCPLESSSEYQSIVPAFLAEHEGGPE